MTTDALDAIAEIDADFAALADRLEALDMEVAGLAERFSSTDGRFDQPPLAGLCDDDGEHFALIPSRERAELAIRAMAARLESAAPYVSDRRMLREAGYTGFGIDPPDRR